MTAERSTTARRGGGATVEQRILYEIQGQTATLSTLLERQNSELEAIREAMTEQAQQIRWIERAVIFIFGAGVYAASGWAGIFQIVG